ncbi:MAG TPA: hypothetical protein EYP22_00605 [Methanosarcinales archaeon]|nr:hypothetical protein [Methanosarcinales archaeon]
MQKSPPNLDIEETSFPNAWARAVRFVMNFGIVLPTEYDNKSKDVCSRITLIGDAIKQIEKMELHPQFPTKKSHLKEYLIQFTREYDWKKQGFEYTYMDRLSNYHNIDQLELLKNNIHRVGSRRLIAITWRPGQDWNTEHPPCLQLIWVRQLKDKGAEVHLNWRSRDLFSAWMSNIIAIVDMLIREVLKPNDLKIIKLVDFCNSLHIYDRDWESAKKVRLVPVNPQELR